MICPRRCCVEYNQVFDLIDKNPKLKISLNISDDDEVLEGPEPRIQGQVVGLLERLDDELNRSLQVRLFGVFGRTKRNKMTLR
jgi:hypothetical protein